MNFFLLDIFSKLTSNSLFRLLLRKNSNIYYIYTLKNETTLLCNQILFILRVSLNTKSWKKIGIRKENKDKTFRILKKQRKFKKSKCKFEELNGKAAFFFFNLKFYMKIFELDYKIQNKNNNSLFYEEFREKFQINVAEFVVSNSVGISIFFLKKRSKWSTEKSKICKFQCQYDRKIPEYCKLRKYKFKSKVVIN